MNVLSHIHIHRLPNPSGVGRVIDRLLVMHAKCYPATRHRMLVDAKLYDSVYRKLDDFWKMASFIPHSHGSSWQQAKWLLTNKPCAEQYWKDVDLVYCPAESYIPVQQAKLVCTIHDVAGFEDSLYPNNRSRQWHCAKWKILFGGMAKHADAVVTVSSFSASRIAHFFPELEPKLRVIYNAPHSIFGSAVLPELDLEVDRLTDGMPYVLVPGGLTLRKNADLILQTIPLILKRVPDVKIVVAGASLTEYRQRLEVLPQQNIVQTGYVSDELLNALYARAAVVWFPSRYEGFGMPVVEAMAAGAPVVTSTAASLPEVAADAALLCDTKTPSEHLEAIQSLLDSPQRRDELIRLGRENSKRFTWRSSAETLEQVFRSLV